MSRDIGKLGDDTGSYCRYHGVRGKGQGVELVRALFGFPILDEKFSPAFGTSSPRNENENVVQRRLDLKISFAIRAGDLMGWHCADYSPLYSE